MSTVKGPKVDYWILLCSVVTVGNPTDLGITLKRCNFCLTMKANRSAGCSFPRNSPRKCISLFIVKGVIQVGLCDSLN